MSELILNTALLVVSFVLFVISSFAKACMDTAVFKWRLSDKRKRPPFSERFRWLQAYMLRESEGKHWSGSLKLDDGWHGAQAVWHLAFGIGFFIAGAVVSNLSLLLLHSSMDRHAPVYFYFIGFVGAWALRLVAHYIGFTKQYPIK